MEGFEQMSEEEMTNDGWGKEWPIELTAEATALKAVIEEAGKIAVEQIEKVYNNLSPTHDPYTNPKAIIYYQCKCGAILDCNTKSFAALNNHASAKGWKIRWGDNSYQPFCVECGKDVE